MNILKGTIPSDAGRAAFAQLGPTLSPFGPLPAAFSLPQSSVLTLQRRPQACRQWIWYFLSPSQWSPSLLLLAKTQFASDSSPGSLSFFSHPCQTGDPALWRNESPGCLKAQPVSDLEGLAIHSLCIVLQATMGCMGARPFVIGSVVNSCWGNKSVTHLWLWIRSSLFSSSSSFFSLASFDT